MQTNAHADIHIHTRPPSSHSAKPSACPTLPSRMFWTAGVMCFFQWCGLVCLICSLVSQGDRSWRRPSDWAVTNPLTTRLTVIGHDHTEGDGVSRWWWWGGWLNGWRDAAMGICLESETCGEGEVSFSFKIMSITNTPTNIHTWLQLSCVNTIPDTGILNKLLIHTLTSTSPNYMLILWLYLCSWACVCVFVG